MFNFVHTRPIQFQRKLNTNTEHVNSLYVLVANIESSEVCVINCPLLRLN